MNSSGKRITQGGGEGSTASKKIHVGEKEEHVLSCLKDRNSITDSIDQNNLGGKTETKEPSGYIFLEPRKMPPGWVNKTFIIPRGKDGGVECFVSQTEYVRDESKEVMETKEERRKIIEKLVRAQEKSFETHGIVPGPGFRPVFSMDMADKL